MYYKVVRRFDDKLLSAYTSIWSNNLSDESDLASVEYKVGEWVKPKLDFTKLMVFSDLEYAKSFFIGWGSDIFECEVENPSSAGLFVRGTPSIVWDLLRIKTFKEINEDYSKYLSSDIPSGTVFCDAVKLIKKVEL